VSRPRPAEASPAGRTGRRSERRSARGGEAEPAPSAGWARRFLRNVLLWLLPVWAVWALLTPYYNRFLLAGAQSLVRLTERPRVTALYPHPDSLDDAYVARLDFPPARRLVKPFRVTDVHFPLVLAGALFLAVPGIPWRERLANLGLALVALVFFQVLLIFLQVKALYATGLGAWSLAHYGPVARNLYGLAWHLFDLPFKLALPFALWAAFYLRLLPGWPAERR
jgi:hypothetical protein